MKSRLVWLAAVTVLSMVVSAAPVTVTFLGHSCFTVREEGGPVVMLDPYGSYVPYPALPRAADVVLITHGHIDHCPFCFKETDRVTGDPVIVWPFDSTGRVREGNWRIVEGLSVRFIEATHVTLSGGGQGNVCLFAFEIGGIRFAHLGDLGRPLTDAQIEALGPVEVLFIPVGGAFTIDAREAITVIESLPTVRVILPMHFRVEGITPWAEIGPLSDFLEVVPRSWTVLQAEDDHVVLTDQDLPAAPTVWVVPHAR